MAILLLLLNLEQKSVLMEVVLLSQCPELLIECVDLLNKEWKRSTSARVQSLEKSILQLPDSLLLIEITASGKQVIGHSRLTRVLEDPYGCWIGSVVISKERRKKGYGKYLMQKTEEYAKVLQYSTAYLNTRDQQGFYEHLGYTYCDPVSSISFSWDVHPSKNIIASGNKLQNEIHLNQSNNNQSHINNACHQHPCSPDQIPPPPPPPPPPLVRPANKHFIMNNNLKSNLGQYWMKKKL